MALFCQTWLPCFASYLILPRGFLFLFSVLKAWLRVPGGPLSKKLLCKVSLSIALSLLSVCIRKRKWPPSTPSWIFSWVQTEIALKCHRKPTIESISNRDAELPQLQRQEFHSPTYQGAVQGDLAWRRSWSWLWWPLHTYTTKNSLRPNDFSNWVHPYSIARISFTESSQTSKDWLMDAITNFETTLESWKFSN